MKHLFFAFLLCLSVGCYGQAQTVKAAVQQIVVRGHFQNGNDTSRRIWPKVKFPLYTTVRSATRAVSDTIYFSIEGYASSLSVQFNTNLTAGRCDSATITTQYNTGNPPGGLGERWVTIGTDNLTNVTQQAIGRLINSSTYYRYRFILAVGNLAAGSQVSWQSLLFPQ